MSTRSASPTIAILAALLLATISGSAAGATGNPANNRSPSAATQEACLRLPPSSPASCTAAVLSDIDSARVEESIAPISLPADFGSLTVAAQLLALVNLERVDRGLEPAIGLTAALDSYAQEGANRGEDPSGPPGYAWGSNWAGGIDSPVFDDFSWVYDDGPGSNNIDCPNVGAAGCWGHRENILRELDGPLAMGAAIQGTSLTELIVGGYTPALAGGADGALAPLWEQIAQTLPIGVSSGAIALRHASRTAPLTIWASGKPMRVIAAISSRDPSWTVVPSECNLAPGTSCQMTLTDGEGAEPSFGTLTLSGPNGPQTLPLSRLIQQRIVARLALHAVARRQPDRLTGAVAPARGGQQVLLQLARGKRWSTIAHTVLNSTGRFAFRILARTRGRRRYRILKSTLDGYEQATSATLALNVR